MCQIKAYLLILNAGSGAVLSPGVSGPVASTCHVHPAGIIPEEKYVNSQNEKCQKHLQIPSFEFYNLLFYGGVCADHVLGHSNFE